MAVQSIDAIDRVAEGVAISLGVPEDKLPTVTRLKQSTPPTKNNGEMARYMKSIWVKNLGEDVLLEQPRQGMGAEDFAYFVDPKHGVKGVYFAVGGTPAEDVETAPSHHSPFFKVEPAPSIKLGTEAMVLGAIAMFNKGK